MSINVYLKGDEVQKLEGFTTKLRREKGQEWNGYELPGVKLWHDKGRWYIMLHEPTEPVPAAVIDIVEEISFYKWISLHSNREAGIYRHESAEAEVEPDKIGDENRLMIHIRAKKMEDLLELYRKIKAGSIRPDESYEGEQGGMSRAELEAKLKETSRSLAAMEAEVERVQRVVAGNLISLRDDLCAFCHQLESGWPFCTKKWVRDRIRAAFSR